ncbi:MAG TPA: xanthine dehydrogenase family protein subunit M [Nocardioidaceae bacterium]|nr:xanthine dehydrogenase family protein subunit M [Nocardioidaceae bacterium]
MREFAYETPDSVDAAIALLAEHDGDARIIAGGTNLVDLMKLDVERPALLVDVSGLALDEIAETDDGGVRIGAMVRNSDLAAHPLIRRRYPAVTQAIVAGASGQLRNMATVGGNLLQRTRCVYFTDATKPCNKRMPGTGCPARDGEHRNLAILGASDACIATNPSDFAVPLAAFDAVVHTRGDYGDRDIPLAEFYRAPDDEPHRETTLPAGAVITGISLPSSELAARSTYRKVRERASYAFAIGSIAAAVDVRDGVVHDVRIALGAVAPMPWRARAAEQALVRRPATADSFRAAADAELDAARPLRDNAYKVPLVRNLIARTLATLSEVDA